MKYIVLSILFVLVTGISHAQNITDGIKYKIVRKDTINIRGIVYDALNRPVPYVLIESKNKEFLYYGYPILTRSDSQGRFELKGALVVDTLRVWAPQNLNIINNGSRYLEIHLPVENKKILPIKPTAEITAKRINEKKPTPAFKVITNEEINDYFGIGVEGLEIIAAYPGGMENFINYVKSKIRYPDKAIKNNIEGEVEIGFYIEKDGGTLSPHVIRGIDYGCDDVVIEAIKASPKWRPAIRGGRPVIDQSSVIISFKLTDK